MALQTSGAISYSQLQSEFGGSNPISASEYYKNGAYVPSTISTTTTVYDSQRISLWTTYVWDADSDGVGVSIYWAGVRYNNSSISAGITSITYGAYTFTRGSYYGAVSGSNLYYVARNYQSTVNETVNTSIPTSGTLSLSNFYGGRKT